MKVLLLLALLITPLSLFSAGLSFSGSSALIDTDYLNVSYPDVDCTISYGSFRYGKISSFRTAELLRPDLSLWEGKTERRKDGSMKGLSFEDEVFSLFLSPGPRAFAGSSVNLHDFRFSFMLYGEGERSDDILSWANERGGEKGETVALSYMGEHFLARSVLYFTKESGVNAFFSGGVSWNGVTLTYSGGRITAFEKTLSLRRQVITLDIASGSFRSEYTLWRGHDPYIGGTYRPHGMKTTVQWKSDVICLKSDFERTFSEKGKYGVSHSYEMLLFGCGIRFGEKERPVFVFSHGGIRVESDLESFSFSASLKGSWWSIRLSFTSELKINTSVSLSLF